MKENDTQESLEFNDICNEIYDMAKPEDPEKIKLHDLINWYLYIIN